MKIFVLVVLCILLIPSLLMTNSDDEDTMMVGYIFIVLFLYDPLFFLTPFLHKGGKFKIHQSPNSLYWNQSVVFFAWFHLFIVGHQSAPFSGTMNIAQRHRIHVLHYHRKPKRDQKLFKRLSSHYINPDFKHAQPCEQHQFWHVFECLCEVWGINTDIVFVWCIKLFNLINYRHKWRVG